MPQWLWWVGGLVVVGAIGVLLSIGADSAEALRADATLADVPTNSGLLALDEAVIDFRIRRLAAPPPVPETPARPGEALAEMEEAPAPPPRPALRCR